MFSHCGWVWSYFGYWTMNKVSILFSVCEMEMMRYTLPHMVGVQEPVLVHDKQRLLTVTAVTVPSSSWSSLS